MLTKMTKRLNETQFLPSLEDIENNELRKLAGKLKGCSDRETLTNILEWQERNIHYWNERGIFEISRLTLILGFSALFWFATFFIALVFLGNVVLALVSSILLSLAFTVWSLTKGTFVAVVYVILFSYPFYKLSQIWLIAGIDEALTFASLNGILFGAALFMLIYLILSYWPFLRQYGTKTKFLRMYEMLSDTFYLSLPVKKISDYRLGICRDYARLTASLLFTVFPNSKIYFLTIPRHVAVAVKIKDNFYVLDQRLPVLTLEKWLMRWGQKKAKIFVSEVLWGSKGEPVEISFKRYDTANLTGFSDTIVDTEKLTSELVYQLKIPQVPEKGEIEFEVTLKNYAVCYERDEIVTYSIVRAIKNRIECEFCSNVEKISKIKVEQRDKDLVVKVYLRSENKI